MTTTALANFEDSISVGAPMPYSVYNGDRKLLLAKGGIVESERMREILIQQGKYQSNDSALELTADEIEAESGRPVEGPMETFARDYQRSSGQSRVGVRVSREENGDGYQCWIVGADESHGLVVTAPCKPDRSLVPVAEGQVWTFRMIYLTAVIKFQATVRKVQFDPVPILHLSIPNQVEMRTIRSSPRVAVCFRGVIELGIPLPMLVTDLSANGLRIAVERKKCELKVGQHIKLTFSLVMLAKSYTFNVPATVVAVRHEFGKRYPDLQFLGIKIESQSEIEMLVLHSFVYEKSATEFNSLWKTLILGARPAQ